MNSASRKKGMTYKFPKGSTRTVSLLYEPQNRLESEYSHYYAQLRTSET